MFQKMLSSGETSLRRCIKIHPHLSMTSGGAMQTGRNVNAAGGNVRSLTGWSTV
jgi:hypothetical protein